MEKKNPSGLMKSRDEVGVLPFAEKNAINFQTSGV